MMDRKSKIVDGYKLTYSTNWINKLEKWDHWYLYWNQAALVEQYVDKNQKIIEAGVGTGFLSNYLKSRGWECETIDIDSEKKPDYVEDITSVDFSALGANCVLAFEIFEHLPFPLFKKSIRNLAAANAQTIIFSVPWSARCLAEVYLRFPKINPLSFSVSMKKRKITTSNHFWELMKRGVTKRSVFEGEKGLINEQDLKR